MADTNRIADGMHDRMNQLRRIAEMTFNPEIREAVLNVADQIEAELKRLEADELRNPAEVKIPPPPQA